MTEQYFVKSFDFIQFMNIGIYEQSERWKKNTDLLQLNWMISSLLESSFSFY